jgi:hypothetical protein
MKYASPKKTIAPKVHEFITTPCFSTKVVSWIKPLMLTNLELYLLFFIYNDCCNLQVISMVLKRHNSPWGPTAIVKEQKS